MRFVRFLCNVGIWLVTFIMVFTVGVIAYDGVSLGVSSDEAIHVAQTNSEKVRFYDIWGFQFADIGENLTTTAPKPYIRNLFGGKGRWADVAINFVAGIFKPIIVPHAQIDNLGEHRTASIYEDLTHDYSEYTNQLPALYTAYTSKGESARYAAFVELASFEFGEDGHGIAKEYASTPEEAKALYLGVKSIAMNTADGNYMVITTLHGRVLTVEHKDGDSYVIHDSDGGLFSNGKKELEITLWNNPEYSSKVTGPSTYFDENYELWVIKGNDALGNRFWQSYKYNDHAYDFYATRFFKLTDVDGSNAYDAYGRRRILTDANHKPIIKTEVIILCLLEWLGFILATIFTIRYPITVIQARVVERRNRRKHKKGDIGVTV